MILYPFSVKRVEVILIIDNSIFPYLYIDSGLHHTGSIGSVTNGHWGRGGGQVRGEWAGERWDIGTSHIGFKIVRHGSRSVPQGHMQTIQREKYVAFVQGDASFFLYIFPIHFSYTQPFLLRPGWVIHFQYMN